MGCSVDGCKSMFHVTCARENGIKMMCTVLDTDHDPKTFVLDEAQERVKHIIVSPAPYSEGIYKAWCSLHKCPPLKKRKMTEQQQQQQQQQNQYQQQIRPSREGVEGVIEYIAKMGLIDKSQHDYIMAQLRENWRDTDEHRYFCECGTGFDTPHSKANHSNSCQIHRLVKNASKRADKYLRELLDEVFIKPVPLFTSSNEKSVEETMVPELDTKQTMLVPPSQLHIQPQPQLQHQKTTKKFLSGQNSEHSALLNAQPQFQSLMAPLSTNDDTKGDSSGSPPAYGNLSYKAVLERLSMYLSRHVEAVYKYWIRRRKDNNDYPLLKMFELAFVGVSHQEVVPTVKISNNKQSYQKLCALNDDLNDIENILHSINVNRNTCIFKTLLLIF